MYHKYYRHPLLAIALLTSPPFRITKPASSKPQPRFSVNHTTPTSQTRLMAWSLCPASGPRWPISACRPPGAATRASASTCTCTASRISGAGTSRRRPRRPAPRSRHGCRGRSGTRSTTCWSASVRQSAYLLGGSAGSATWRRKGCVRPRYRWGR